MKDKDGNVTETPEQLFTRVASFIAEAERAYVKDHMATTDADSLVERWSEKFYDMMASFDFLPNSPTLMNAGRPLGQLSACFVLSVEDSMDGIFTTLKDAAMIHKSGGGTGFSFSRIRPKNSYVSTTGGKASGPVSFMHAYNAATGTVAQGGTRRGANMGILRVDHPDIMEFITVKQDPKELTNFNLSVGITDEFMEALKNKTSYNLYNNDHNVIGSMDAVEVFDTIVKCAWNTGEPGIIFLDKVNANNFLEPIHGKIEATNPCVSGDTLLTTDKGDIPIQDCVGKLTKIWNGYEWSFVTPKVTGHNLESLIITIDDGKKITCTKYHKFLMCTAEQKTCIVERKEAKDLKLGDVLYPWYMPGDIDGKNTESHCIVNIEDGPILETVYCLEEPVRHTFMANGIVVGNCGEQPLLPYEACNLGSINLRNFVKEDGSFDMNRLAVITRIAVRFLDDVIDVNKYPLQKIDDIVKKTRKIGLGVMGFADALQEMNIPYASETGFNMATMIMSLIQNIAHDESERLAHERGAYPDYYELINLTPSNKNMIPFRRNAFVTTIAPTGSISAIAGVSSGIEPLFANIYWKHYMDDDWHPIVNERLKECLIEEDCWGPEVEKVLKETGTIAHIDSIPQHIRDVYACAHDITPKAHVMMQACFQKHVDNAISKTINFNTECTEDDIRQAYILAYNLGCKGITVYRNGCRDTQVLNVKKESPKASDTVPAEHAAENLEDLLKDVDPAKLIEAFNNVHSDCKLRIEYPELSYMGFRKDITPIGYQQVVNQFRPKSMMDKNYVMSIHSVDSTKDACMQNEILFNAIDEDGNFQPLMLRDSLERIRPGIMREMTESVPKEDTLEIQERPSTLEGHTTKVDINCGKLYLTLNKDENGKLFEVFSTTGKSGGCPAQSEAVCRLVSLALRAGIDPEEITRQLCGIKCMACVRNPKIKVLSCPDAIGREIKASHTTDVTFTAGGYTPPADVIKRAEKIKASMKKHDYLACDPVGDAQREILKDLTKKEDEKIMKDLGIPKEEEPVFEGKDTCPYCGAEMKHVGGCKNCLQCGYSSCG